MSDDSKKLKELNDEFNALKEQFEELKSKKEELEKQNKDLNDKLLIYANNIRRLDGNLRNDVPREKKQIEMFAIGNFIDVANNAKLLSSTALSNIEDTQTQECFKFFDKDLLRILKKYNVEVKEVKIGDVCNYDYCSAQAFDETGEFPEGTIVQVFSNAFFMSEQCISKANVIVSKAKKD